MQLVIYGPGRLGGAIAAAAAAAGWPAPVLVGRPDPDGRRPAPPRADVVVDASTSAAVAANVEQALLAGNRAFVLATTGWDADIGRIRGGLIEHGATADRRRPTCRSVPRCSCGWPSSRPGGTPAPARSSRRSWSGTGGARPTARPAPPEPSPAASSPPIRGGPRATTFDGRPVLEVAGIRAGAAPGTHLVTFDGTGRVDRAPPGGARPLGLRRRRPGRRPVARP